MEVCFCVEVITVNTCSLLSLIGLQLVLIVCEGGLLLSPAEEFTVGGNSGEVNARKLNMHMPQSSTLCPIWLVASGVCYGKLSQTRSKKGICISGLLPYISSAQYVKIQGSVGEIIDINLA